VSVATDRNRYREGESIRASVTNGLGVTIFAPRGGVCAVVSVSRQSDASWVTADACPPDEVNVTEIAAGQTVEGLLGPFAPPPTASKPVVIGPVSPAGNSRPIASLPIAQSGPSRVVPEGAIAPPFSATISSLGPGTYRLSVTFARGSREAPAETVYSEPFVVEPAS
jgi:hypothetical protein